MPRDLRWVPPGGGLIEVTVRTIQSRLLLRPHRRLNEIIVGIAAKAQEHYPEIRCHGIVVMSNHTHLLVWTPTAKVLADFMQFFNSNVAREAGRFHDWKDKIWSRRYQAILVGEDMIDQVGRLHYFLRHGCKENLVWRPGDWPGVNAVEALTTGRPLVGLWFDRTKEYAARQRGEEYGALDYATEMGLEIEPLPCWSHLDEEAVRAHVAKFVAAIEAETAKRHEESCTEPLGVKAILKQHPHGQPVETKKSPAPRFHIWCPEVRKLMYKAYALFVTAYREAAARLKAGERDVEFPEGSFPPPLPFVEPVPI